MTLVERRSRQLVAIAVLLLAVAPARAGEPEREPDPKIFEDLLLLPEFEFEYEPSDN